MSQARNLKAGVFLPPFHPADEDTTLLMERDIELMQWLDKVGFAEAWIGEHHSGGYEIYGCPEMFIAAAAMVTKNIRLGTGVISVPYHNPLILADRICQLDHQTRGRAMFGFGPGLLPSDAIMLGIDPEVQRDRMIDGIDIIARLFNGEVITKTTDWYELHNARLHLQPYTKPRPYMAIASSATPNGGKIAGRHGMGMISVAAGARDGYDALDTNWRLANEISEQHGRKMQRSDWRIMAPFHIAETREQALANCRDGFKKWEKYGYAVSPNGGAAIGLPSLEGINENGYGCIGTPDEALVVLERFWQKTGGFGTVLLLAHDFANWEATKKSYELFANYVLPKFNATNTWRNESMEWLRENNVPFSQRRNDAMMHTIQKHFAEEAKKKTAAE
ncbi:MAG TPA: LLM class flavin-dependent oxidoreductase [Stellaceae bacterium]|nr:LLM class flavin-dependent oxidoreductase [Stellaceae bacterium]